MFIGHPYADSLYSCWTIRHFRTLESTEYYPFVRHIFIADIFSVSSLFGCLLEFVIHSCCHSAFLIYSALRISLSSPNFPPTWNYFLCVDVGMDVENSEDNLQELILSFYYVNSGIEIRSLGLVASAFTCWAISPALCQCFLLSLYVYVLRNFCLHQYVWFSDYWGVWAQLPQSEKDMI